MGAATFMGEMDEVQAQQLYDELIKRSRIAFDGRVIPAANHMLAVAMSIAASLEDTDKLLQVEALTCEQCQQLVDCGHFDFAFGGEVDLHIYQSLLQLTRSRLLLIPKPK